MSKAIWSWGPGELRRPHEGFLVDGRLLVFDNDNDSRILAVDPVTKTITWRYESADFHSASRGGVVPLSGGNLLLTESNSGRSIEVTPDGEVVWEWKNPHLNEKGHRVTIRRMSWIPPENLPSDLQAAARP